MAALSLLPVLNGRSTQQPTGEFMMAALTGEQEVPAVSTVAQGGALFAVTGGVVDEPDGTPTSTPAGTPTETADGTPTETADGTPTGTADGTPTGTADGTPTGTPGEEPQVGGVALHYALAATSIDDVTMAHIHQGAAGQNGPVVAWLYPSPEVQAVRPIEGTFDGVLAADIVTEDDLVGPLEGEPLSELVSLLRDGNAYVNVHTDANPDGEIRGEAVPLPDLVAAVDEWQRGAQTGTPTEEPGTGTPTEEPGTETGTPTEEPGTGTPTESPGNETETATETEGG